MSEEEIRRVWGVPMSEVDSSAKQNARKTIADVIGPNVLALDPLNDIFTNPKWRYWSIKDAAQYFVVCFNEGLWGLSNNQGQIDKLRNAFGLPATNDPSPRITDCIQWVRTNIKRNTFDINFSALHEGPKGVARKFISDLIGPNVLAQDPLNDIFTNPKWGYWTLKDAAQYFVVCYNEGLWGLWNQGEIGRLRATFCLPGNCEPTKNIADCIKWVRENIVTELSPGELKLGSRIGEGAFGVVFSGEYRGRKVAIKKLKNQNPAPQDLATLKRELANVARLRHSSIVHFFGAIVTPGNLSIVTELCPYGSFSRAMKEHPKEFNDALKIKCLINVSSGLVYLHQQGVIHRDIKPDNVLIVSLQPRSEICAKLTDFGVSRAVDPSSGASTIAGTPGFMAPEVACGKKYDKSVDVYSLAILVFFAFGGKVPPVIEELMKKCRSLNPSERPSSSAVLAFFEKYFKEHFP